MFHVKHSTTRRRPTTRRSQPLPPINHHPAQCGTRPPAPAPPAPGNRRPATVARCPLPTIALAATDDARNRRRHPATGTNHCPHYLRPAPTGQLSTLTAAHTSCPGRPPSPPAPTRQPPSAPTSALQPPPGANLPPPAALTAPPTHKKSPEDLNCVPKLGRISKD